MTTMVVGLGNRFVHDDGAGLRVVEELRRRGIDRREGVELKEYEEMDLSILQEVGGASRLILVDSLKSGAKPGSVSVLGVKEGTGEPDRLPSLHELDLSEMVNLGRRMGILGCPVSIVGIEPADLSLGEGLSKEVEVAIPAAADAVQREMGGGEETSTLSSGPRLTVILVNQSASMGRELSDYGISLAEGVADVINLYLQKVTQRRAAEREKGQSEFDSDNFGIAVIGYGAKAGAAERLLYMGAGEMWADERLTKSPRPRTSSDESFSTFPVWMESVAAGDSPLREALAEAYRLVGSWIPSHRLAPPPQVINITDGSVTGGEPAEEARRLGALSTYNGRVVLWTCQVAPGSGSQPVLFPADGAPPGVLAGIFECTSEFPRELIPNLMMEFPEVSRVDGARAGVFGADLTTLVRFLSFVTRVPLP